MKRFIFTLALAMGISMAAHAQFTEGTKYLGASVTGLSMNYSKNADFNLGLNLDAGYYFADAWMLKGNFNYNHAKLSDGLAIGAGVRYSFLQNGIFLGAGLEYNFNKFSQTPVIRTNDMRIPVEIGYTFYLNHYLAIEPAVYSKMSLNHFSDGTEFGLKIGLGFYFDRLHNVK